MANLADNFPLRAGKGCLYEGGIRLPLLVRGPGRVEAARVPESPPTSVTGSIAGDLYWYYPHYSPQNAQPGAAIQSGNGKWIEHDDPPAAALYDLKADPGEERDLASTRPEMRVRLLEKLHAALADAGAHRYTPNPVFRQEAAQ